MNDYEAPRSFRFVIGFDEVRKEFNHDAARFYGMRLAGLHQTNVKVLCFNNALSNWTDLGTWTPQGYFVDSFGYVCTIAKDGRGLNHFGRYGKYYSLTQVIAMAKSGIEIITANTNKVEFANGVVFIYDHNKGGYKVLKGARPSYSKGYDTNYDEEGGTQ